MILWGGIYTRTAEAKGESVKSANLMNNSGVHTQHVLDFNGDGITDISVVRNINGSIVWFTYDGVSAPPAGITYNYFGLVTTDFLTPANFDNDTKTDIAIWRPGLGGSAGFYILQSTDNTVRFEAFGQTNDDSSV